MGQLLLAEADAGRSIDRVKDATCVEDNSDGSRYTCLVDFRGGPRQTYTVTVEEDGTWEADLRP